MEDDLSKKLDSLLGSPEGLQKIQSMMSALGVGAENAVNEPPPVPPTPSIPDGLLQLLPLLSQMGQDDENTTLLKALRPYLHGEREKRLEDSVKMMQLLKFLPLLQNGGGQNT